MAVSAQQHHTWGIDPLHLIQINETLYANLSSCPLADCPSMLHMSARKVSFELDNFHAVRCLNFTCMLSFLSLVQVVQTCLIPDHVLCPSFQFQALDASKHHCTSLQQCLITADAVLAAINLPNSEGSHVQGLF